MKMLITNNEKFLTTTAKSAVSNDIPIYALDNNEPISSVTSIKRLPYCRSKHINENKDNNKFIGLVTSIKRLCGRVNKLVGKNNKNSD